MTAHTPLFMRFPKEEKKYIMHLKLIKITKNNNFEILLYTRFSWELQIWCANVIQIPVCGVSNNWYHVVGATDTCLRKASPADLQLRLSFENLSITRLWSSSLLHSDARSGPSSCSYSSSDSTTISISTSIWQISFFYRNELSPHLLLSRQLINWKSYIFSLFSTFNMSIHTTQLLT